MSAHSSSQQRQHVRADLALPRTFAAFKHYKAVDLAIKTADRQTIGEILEARNRALRTMQEAFFMDTSSVNTRRNCDLMTGEHFQKIFSGIEVEVGAAPPIPRMNPDILQLKRATDDVVAAFDPVQRQDVRCAPHEIRRFHESIVQLRKAARAAGLRSRRFDPTAAEGDGQHVIPHGFPTDLGEAILRVLEAEMVASLNSGGALLRHVVPAVSALLETLHAQPAGAAGDELIYVGLDAWHNLQSDWQSYRTAVQTNARDRLTRYQALLRSIEDVIDSVRPCQLTHETSFGVAKSTWDTFVDCHAAFEAGESSSPFARLSAHLAAMFPDSPALEPASAEPDAVKRPTMRSVASIVSRRRP